MCQQLKYYLVLLFVGSTLFLHAQDEHYYQMTEEDVAYREFRQRSTVPPYGLYKIKELIKTLQYKAQEDGDAGITALTAAQFKSLSLREKFTYSLIHPEMYAQNCAIFMPQADEQKKIFSHLMSWMDENQWSDRQIDFLRENRDSVMSIIQESTLRSGHMGVNYKNAIETINGWEMIPFIIDYYKSNSKDKDALTLLLLLMKKGEYVEFIQSSSYRQLYGSDYNYESYIRFNTANQDLVINRAMGYYREKSSK